MEAALAQRSLITQEVIKTEIDLQVLKKGLTLNRALCQMAEPMSISLFERQGVPLFT
jgi:hypothetical protein